MKNRMSDIIKIEVIIKLEGETMSTVDDVLERIRIIECPTGTVEDKVAGILEDYGFGPKSQIIVNRDEKLDKDGAQAYMAKAPYLETSPIVILAKSGREDYVAKVVDAYIS